MQVTLIKTRETLDVSREMPDGTVKTVGSYWVSVSDPTFVRKSEDLIAEMSAAQAGGGQTDDYEGLTAKCSALLRSAFERPEDVDDLLGERPDLFNSMLLLTAVMQIVNAIDPGRRAMEQLDAMLPDRGQIASEMAASSGK